MGNANLVQYVGEPGNSEACVVAVMRLIQFRDRIKKVSILTHSNNHCLLLKVNQYEVFAVKSGFTSGYPGQGPRSLALILKLLRECNAEIEEYEVRKDILNRIDRSALTDADWERIRNATPVRPKRWYAYINYEYINYDMWKAERHRGWHYFPPVIPFSIIDRRIMDLALRFFDSPDECLITGYRRLESIVRERTGLETHGAKLFSEVFQGKPAKLGWIGLDSGEVSGRVNLFTGCYKAYRNPRAHREPVDDDRRSLAEFLLLNQLYILEDQAVELTT